MSEEYRLTAVILIRSQVGLIMISDLMLTSKIKPEKNGLIPTVNSNADGKAGDKFIKGLEQKIVFINDNITIGWASGDVSEAKFFIKYIAHYVGISTPDVGTLKLTIDQFRTTYPNKLDRTEYVIVHTSVSEGSTNIGIFNKDADRSSIGKFEDVLSIGSGGRALKAQLSEFEKNKFPHPSVPIVFPDYIKDEPDQQEYREDAMTAMMIVSYVAIEQFSSGYGLESWWGGGFEICTLEMGKMEKLSNFMLQYYGIDLNNRLAKRVYFKVYQIYVENHLIIYVQKDDGMGARETVAPHLFFKDSFHSKTILSANYVITYLRDITTSYGLFHICMNPTDCGVMGNGVTTDIEIRCSDSVETDILNAAHRILTEIMK